MTTPGAASRSLAENSPPDCSCPAHPPEGGGADGPAEPDPWPPLGAAAFDAQAALSQLKRSLRDLKLAERGEAFELRGKRVLELKLAGAAIEARIARKLANTPEWDRATVANTTDQRKLLDDVKKRLARWEQED